MKLLKLNRYFNYASLILASALLSACGSGAKDADDVSLKPVVSVEEINKQTAGFPIFDPTSGNLPFPNDLFFSGSTDGTLNLPIADGTSSSDPKYALNALDGFSTSAPLSVSFSKAMDATTINAAVKVYEVSTSLTTKAVESITATLALGTDYVLSLGTDGKTLAVVPLKPLKPKTSYMVVVTNQMKDSDGLTAATGLVYSYLKLATPLVDGTGTSQVTGLPDSSAVSLEPVRQFTQAQLGYAVAQGGLKKEDIVMSWSFTTTSTVDVLAKVTTGVTNTTMAVMDTTQTTAAFGGSGAAKVYAGTITVPYYQTAAAKGSTDAANPALTKHWVNAQGNEVTWISAAQGDAPAKTADVTIPVLMTVPTTGSNWKVAIFQHGITSNRSALLAMGDSLAAAGYVGVAIDMPLHGITPTDGAAALRNNAVTERTFDMDADNDGTVDSSGKHFINLTSLLTARDNLRQTVVDLVHVKAALGSITGLDVNENDVSFIGHSLGGMVGALFVNQATDLKAAVYGMPGLQAAYLLDASATFGPVIEAGLAGQGVTKGTADYAQFLRAAQTVLDSADPVNYVAANTATPALLFEVVGDGANNASDQVIPNAVATAPLAGTNPWIGLQSLSTVTGTGAVTGNKGVMRFTAGGHSSLLSPTDSAEVTQTMQEAAVSFLSTVGASVAVTSNSTVQQLTP